jgi:uncharacterized protein with GYD domain
MTRHLLALLAAAWFVIAFPSGGIFAQQSDQKSQPTVSGYLISAELTDDGVKVLQKQVPTAVRASIAKFAESIGGKLEAWYFNYRGTAGYGIMDYSGQQIVPDNTKIDMTVKANGVEIAHVTLMPLITAEDADKAFAQLIQSQKR